MLKSPSLEARIKGNKFYIDSGIAGLSYTLKRGRLQDAMASYVRAETLAANNMDEYASASKNRGKAASHLVKLMRERAEYPIHVVFYVKEAIVAFCSAYEKSESCKQVDWREEVLRSLNTSLEELISVCEEIQDTNEKFKILASLTEIISVESAAVELHIRLANVLFHDAMQKLQNCDYRGSLSRLKDCYRPIEEARRLNKESDKFCQAGEIGVIWTDVYYHTCTAESIQAREIGHQLLDVAIREEESLNVDLVWDVIDWYKRSTILAKELDLEQEAISLSHLGYVYKKVLKLKQKAKEYYKKSLELAESMKPRTFLTKDWYQECVSTLQEFQTEERMRDEREKQKERDKKLEEVKEEMADLKVHNTGRSKLLVHIYNTYPPKNPKWKKPSEEEMKKWDDMEMKDMKKVLLKAINSYHPDKVHADEHGEKWKTLSEEITKLLTAYYEFTKVG